MIPKKKKKNEGGRKGIRRVVGRVPGRRGCSEGKRASVRCYRKVKLIVP